MNKSTQRSGRSNPPTERPDPHTGDTVQWLCATAYAAGVDLVIYLGSHVTVRGEDPARMSAILREARRYEPELLSYAGYHAERLKYGALDLLEGVRLRWPLENGGWSDYSFVIIEPTLEQRAAAAIDFLRSCRGLALRRARADGVARTLEQLLQLSSVKGRG